MFPLAHTPLPIPILWRKNTLLSPNHFSWLYFMRELEGSFRIVKGHFCNTLKLLFFFFFLRLAPQILSSFLFKMKNKNFIWLQRQGRRKEVEKEKRGGEKRESKKEKRKFPQFPLTFSFVLKVWLGSAMRILKVFSISSSSSFLSLTWHYFLSPPKKHSPEFFRDFRRCIYLCRSGREKKAKASVLGQDQRCWHQGPKYALDKQYLFTPLFLTFCSSKWSSSPPRKNSFIQGS